MLMSTFANSMLPNCRPAGGSSLWRLLELQAAFPPVDDLSNACTPIVGGAYAHLVALGGMYAHTAPLGKGATAMPSDSQMPGQEPSGAVDDAGGGDMRSHSMVGRIEGRISPVSVIRPSMKSSSSSRSSAASRGCESPAIIIAAERGDVGWCSTDWKLVRVTVEMFDSRCHSSHRLSLAM